MDKTLIFRCPQCKKVKSTMHYLKIHLLRQHNKYIYGLTCYENPRCKPNIFPSEELMNEHMTEEHKYKNCEVYGCTKVFAYERNRGSHVSMFHTPKKRCKYCTKMFPIKSFENHSQSCKAKNDEPIKCDQCDKTFARKSSLKKHQHVHTFDHEQDTILLKYNSTKCPHCPQKLARKDMILKHVQLEHSEIWQNFHEKLKENLNSKTKNCTDCDLQFHVVWTGTDENGKYLNSFNNRFSAFQPKQIQDYFKDSITKWIPTFDFGW